MSDVVFSYIFSDPSVEGYDYKIECVKEKPGRYTFTFCWNRNETHVTIAFQDGLAFLDKGVGVRKDISDHYAENLHSLLADDQKVGTRDFNALSVLSRAPVEISREIISKWVREARKARKESHVVET